MKTLAICLTLFTVILQTSAASDPVRVELAFGDAPEGGWTVGDHIPLRLSVTAPADLEVTLPELPQAWGPLEIIEQMPTESIENEDGTFTLVKEAMVTAWSPGDLETPPVIIHYRDEDNQLHESLAPPQSLTVVSVLEEGDLTKRDLKPQVALPAPPLWPWLLGGALLAILTGIAGWMLWTRIRCRAILASQTLPAPDPRPAHEIAYTELDRIATLDLPAQGKLKHHYTLVADCLRAYVHGRYQIPAMDQTTGELLATFRRAHIDRGHTRLFHELFTKADLVKFAKFLPPKEQARAVVAQARHIVDTTKPQDAPESDRIQMS